MIRIRDNRAARDDRQDALENQPSTRRRLGRFQGMLPLPVVPEVPAVLMRVVLPVRGAAGLV